MIDHDQLARSLRVGLEIAEPREVTAVERHHHFGLGIHLVGRVEQVETGQVAIVRRHHERHRERRDGVDAGGAQHVMERERGAQGVTVGIDMADECDTRRHSRSTLAARLKCRRQYPAPRSSFTIPPVAISLVLRLGLVVDTTQDLLDALPGEDAGVGLEREAGHLPDPHLPPDEAPEMGRSRAQARRRPAPRTVGTRRRSWRRASSSTRLRTRGRASPSPR